MLFLLLHWTPPVIRTVTAVVVVALAIVLDDRGDPDRMDQDDDHHVSKA